MISELFQVINEHCPDAVKSGEIKNQFGRKVAIDAWVDWSTRECTVLTTTDQCPYTPFLSQ